MDLRQARVDNNMASPVVTNLLTRMNARLVITNNCYSITLKTLCRNFG